MERTFEEARANIAPDATGRPDSEVDSGAGRLDTLVADFAGHVRRLAALDVSGVTNADIVAELRDNAYPSLLILAEELREIDAELGEVSASDASLAPEHALAIAAALRCGQDLAAAVRKQMSDVGSENAREELTRCVERFDSRSRVAAEVLHSLVAVDDEDDDDGAVLGGLE